MWNGAFIIALLIPTSILAAPTTQSTTQPSRTVESVLADIDQDKHQLEIAESASIAAFKTTSEYAKLIADRDNKAAAMKMANDAEDQKAKLDASREYAISAMAVTNAVSRAKAQGDKSAQSAKQQLQDDQTALASLKATEKQKDDAIEEAKMKDPIYAATIRGELAVGMTTDQAMKAMNGKVKTVIEEGTRGSIYDFGYPDSQGRMFIVIYTATFRDGRLVDIYHHDINGQVEARPIGKFMVPP